MRHLPTLRAAIAATLLFAPALTAGAVTPRFEISFSAGAHAAPITGRLVLFLSKTNQAEPRLQLSPRGPALFGLDIDQLKPGQTAVIDNSSVGWPGALADLPAGDYYAQAVIHVYELAHRSDGKNIWVHLNDGTIDILSVAPGNVYSDPQLVHVGADGTVKIEITHVIAPAAKPQDTEWIKHVTVQSAMLTKFWGRPIFVHAHVLLPKGYAEHPNTYYPSVYTLGHGQAPLSFSTTPPRNGAPKTVNPATGLESGYATYQAWSGDDYPRVIAISLEQQTPYFPDSYSVNSVNNGPYGDAIQLEAWEAIYGPIGEDGYPVPLWNKLTGTIDHTVATYMRDHGYDLRAYADKMWPTIGSKLVGKLHFSAGDMDDYWLNLAVYKFEDFLKSTTSPHYEGDFVYGRPMKGHAWHYATWADFMRKVGATIKSQAPAGENTAAWNY